MKLEIALLIALATGLSVAPVSSYADASREGRDGQEMGERAEAARAKIGYDIAPVPLNLAGRNRFLVGLGSYLVNAVSDCNGCHSAGPATEYAPGGNPYFKGNPPQVVNQATYLGGGRIFGSQIPGRTPSIVSRNLTPDKTGRPEGGRTFAEFRELMRTGADLDHQHPNCSDPKVLSSTSCFPTTLPFNGDLLQIMPWPAYQNMTDRELRAIYEYLSAIPCIAGPATGPLHNDCS
jgi:hypothetical protein